jgi:outer membrane autotransporter protein
MRKTLVFCTILALVGGALPASAQIVNPSFETGDFTGWTMAGNPSVGGAPPTVPNGNFQALVNSTGLTGTGVYAMANAVNAVALDAFLGITLPATNGPAFNGEAISQTFTLAEPEKLTFDVKYASRELLSNNADGTGYVVNGVYHFIANASTPGQSMAEGVGFLDSGLPYQTLTINLPAGTNTLAFVAYNTINGDSPSGLYIDNLTLTPLAAAMTTFGLTPGLDPNQRSIANYIDAHSTDPTPTLAKIITILEAAPNSAVLAQDLNALSPESLGLFRTIAFNNASFFTEDVDDHLAALRDGLSGFDTSGLNVNSPSQSPQESQIKRHLEEPKDMRDPKDMSDAKEMTPAVTTNQLTTRWGVWAAGDVVLAEQGHDQDIEHQNYTTGSVMLGADYRLDPHFTVGVLVGYGHTGAQLDNEGGKATADTYFPGLYASYVDGGWYANGLVAYNYNSYTEDRHVNLPGLSGFDHGAFQGNEYLADLNGGYEFQSGSFKYGPFAGLQYVHLELDPYTEDGLTSLSIQRQEDDSLRSQLGFEARYVTFVGDIALVPHASVAWQHEFLANDHSITSSFTGAGGGSFTVQTEDNGEDSAFIDVGLDATVCRNVTLFLDYQTEAGASNFYAQSILAGAAIGF